MAKLCKPYANAQPNHVFQRFGVVQPAASQGVSGSTTHTGVDMAFYKCYGTFLVAPEDSVVVNVITPTTYLLDTSKEVLRGYGVMLKSSLRENTFFLYWHCLPVFPVSVGQNVKQ